MVASAGYSNPCTWQCIWVAIDGKEGKSLPVAVVPSSDTLDFAQPVGVKLVQCKIPERAYLNMSTYWEHIHKLHLGTSISKLLTKKSCNTYQHLHMCKWSACLLFLARHEVHGSLRQLVGHSCLSSQTDEWPRYGCP